MYILQAYNDLNTKGICLAMVFLIKQKYGLHILYIFSLDGMAFFAAYIVT